MLEVILSILSVLLAFSCIVVHIKPDLTKFYIQDLHKWGYYKKSFSYFGRMSYFLESSQTFRVDRSDR